MISYKWIKGLALAVCTSLPAQGAEVRVFAAASLQGPLDQIAAQWPGSVAISYGGSGTIARQVSLGAPADVIVLANTVWAEWLQEKEHVAQPWRAVMSNRLVLVAPPGAAPLDDVTAVSLLRRLDGGRLAMGQHMSVPAGIYGAAWLSGIDAWDALRPHLAETENVRAALALVARGEVPLGLVYASDAKASTAVSVVWNVAPTDHPTITYQASATTPAGRAFLDHLITRVDVFVDAGFAVLP